MNKNYDDGNWNWIYECIYVNDTNNPKDYFYVIVFETEKGGYLSGNEITCFYKKEENILQIHKEHTAIDFFVENFSDIKSILKPLIKANKAVPYPIHISNNSIRKDKLKTLR